MRGDTKNKLNGSTQIYRGKNLKGEKKHYIHRKFNSSPNIYGYLFYMSNVYVYKCLPSECGFYWICGLVGW